MKKSYVFQEMKNRKKLEFFKEKKIELVHQNKERT